MPWADMLYSLFCLFSVTSINLPPVNAKPLGPLALVAAHFKAVAGFDLSLVFETAAPYAFLFPSASENPRQLLLTNTLPMLL